MVTHVRSSPRFGLAPRGPSFPGQSSGSRFGLEGEGLLHIADVRVVDVGGGSERLGAFLDEYERWMPPSNTTLGAWTADGNHQNYGRGSRPDYHAFLADLVVWFTTGSRGKAEGVPQSLG